MAVRGLWDNLIHDLIAHGHDALEHDLYTTSFPTRCGPRRATPTGPAAGTMVRRKGGGKGNGKGGGKGGRKAAASDDDEDDYDMGD